MLNKKKNGFSLIETLLVLVIMSIFSIWKYTEIDNDMKNMLAKNLSAEMEQLGQATNAFINLRYQTLSTLESDTGLNCDKQNNTCDLTVEGLIAEKLLPESYRPVNKFGSGYHITLKREGNAPNYMINGLIITDKPILGHKKEADKLLLGRVLLHGGPDFGYSDKPNSVSGYSGLWSEKQTDYNTIDQAGLLAYRVGYNANMYSIYLRRDGTLPMTGNLNLDGNDINNISTTNTKNANISDKLISETDTQLYGKILHVNTDETIFDKRVDMKNSLFIEGSELNAKNADASFKNIHASGNIISDGNITAKNRVTVGEFLKLEKTVTAGQACSETGIFSRDDRGELMTCISGKWEYIAYKEHFVRMGVNGLTVTSPGNYKYVLVSASSKFSGRDGSHYRFANFVVKVNGAVIGSIKPDQSVRKGGSRGHSWVYEGYGIKQQSFSRQIKRGDVVSVSLNGSDYHISSDIRLEFVN